MSGATTPTATPTDTLSTGQAALDKELQNMSDAFAFATSANSQITVLKTVDGAIETASQQRPNIG